MSKTILITGASSGIGKATAKRFQREGWNVVERVHTKKGHTYYQVELQARVSREEFVRLRDSAKAAGGWYSRQWAGIPGGFAFAEAEDARQWAASEFGGAA